MVDRKRVRKRIQLTVDPVVWARCQALSEIAGPALSWSQVAESAFVILLDQLEVMQEEVFKKLRSDATDHEIRAALGSYMSRQMTHAMDEAYTQMDEELKKPPAPVKRGRRPG